MLSATIIQKQDDQYTLKLENGGTFVIPERDLDVSSRTVGTEVYLSLHPVGQSANQSQSVALLNQLLGA